MDDEVNCALPVTSAEHDVHVPPKPPTGTRSVNESDEPDTVPVTVPCPTLPAVVSVIVKEPDTAAPECSSCHNIWPGPEESTAEPDHEPVRLADGPVPPPESPPPQAGAAVSARATQAAETRRAKAWAISKAQRTNWNLNTWLQKGSPSATGLRSTSSISSRMPLNCRVTQRLRNQLTPSVSTRSPFG